MRKAAVVLSLLLGLGAPAWLAAHEGHAHKVMGVVTAIDATHVEVDTKDGKKDSVLLSKDTKFMKGKRPATAADVKVGHRVVLTVAEAEGKRTAREVTLGSGTKEEAAKPHDRKH